MATPETSSSWAAWPRTLLVLGRVALGLMMLGLAAPGFRVGVELTHRTFRWDRWTQDLWTQDLWTRDL